MITDEQIIEAMRDEMTLYEEGATVTDKAELIRAVRAVLALQPSASAEPVQPVDAARVRDEALKEAATLCESRTWRSLEGIAEDIRALIGIGGKLDQSGEGAS